MKRKLATNIILLVVGFCGFTWGLLTGQSTTPYGYEYKLELLDAYDQYYERTETLLDSICSSGVMKEDAFTDVVMETDTYYEYEVVRDKIDSLYKL